MQAHQGHALLVWYRVQKGNAAVAPTETLRTFCRMTGIACSWAKLDMSGIDPVTGRIKMMLHASVRP